MGFLPVQRIEASGVRFTRGFPTLGTFRLQGFSPSCRFTPPEAVRVYFTPVALIGFSPSGAFPLKKPRDLIGQRRAFVAFLPTAAGCLGAPAVGATVPRI